MDILKAFKCKILSGYVCKTSRPGIGNGTKKFIRLIHVFEEVYVSSVCIEEENNFIYHSMYVYQLLAEIISTNM